MHEGRKKAESEHPPARVRASAMLLVVLLVSSALLFPGLFVGDSSAESVPSHERLFRLHEGDNITTSSDYDWLNSSAPAEHSTLDYDGDGLWGVTIRKNLPSERWRHFWVLDPALSSDVNILGNLSAHVWAASRDNESSSMMTVQFADMGPADWYDPGAWTSIASVTVPLLGPVYSSFKAYDLVATDIDYVLPSGHRLVVTITRGDSANDGLLILYDNYLFDSYVTFDTPDFVSVDSVDVVDDGGAPRSTYSDSETVTVVANVSNPYGSYEILGATLQVSYASNGTVVEETEMAENAEDASYPSSWKTFTYTLPPLPNGTLRVLVLAADPQGVPSWLSTTILVVGVDHFEVDAPSVVTVMEPFTVDITAANHSGSVIAEWLGTVSMEAYLPDLSTPAAGLLGVGSVTLTAADAGTVTVPNQTYDSSEETIVIRAFSGPHEGWSSPISVRSGPVVDIDIVSDSPSEVAAGTTISLSATGQDVWGNANSTWTPNWTLSDDIGTLAPDGLDAVLYASTVGTASVNCTNDLNGASASLSLTVSPSSLTYIVISPSGTLTIREGKTAALSATGYDYHGNEVGIGGAVWSTNTSGSLSGSGESAVYTAGYIPETGVIEVSVGSVSASLEVVVLNAEDGPWLSNIPAQVATEDSNWTLVLTSYWHHVNGTSGLRWYAENVNTSLYTVLHDPSTEAYVRFLTQPDKFGSDVFRLWVRDQNGFSTYQDIAVDIQSVNDRPLFVNDPPTELYVKFDTPYSFDYSYYVRDVDTDKSELRIETSLPTNVYFDRLIGTFLFPERSDVGDYFEVVTLTVTDAPEGSRLDSTNSHALKIVVWVTDDTPPSLLEGLPDVTLFEGETRVVFDLDDYFYDLDDDYLFYTYGFENVVIEIDPVSHNVTISALLEWSGTTEGVFTAIDPVGALKSDTIVITVIAVNDPPEFKNPGTIHVRYETPYHLDAEMYVSDPDNALEELSFSFDTPYVTYESKNLVLTFPQSMSGEPFSEPYIVPVEVNVSDPSGAYALCNFEVVVSDNVPPEVRTPVPYYDFVSFLEDTYLNGTIVLDVLFYDADDSSLNYTVVGNESVHVTIYPDSVVNFTAAVNWSGSETVVFRAIDPHGGWCSWQVTVTVIPVNDPPVILPIPDFVVRGGPRNMHFDISQYIMDSESSYSELTVTATPSPEAFVVGRYLYVSIPEGVSSIVVSLSARDPSGSESNEVTFRVVLQKTWAEMIGYPYTLPIVLMAAGIGGYLIARRLPRPFELEDLFLIHNDGRLISHVTKDEDSAMDKDVVSAMFTAVQEFVRDSFQAGEVGLKKLEIGDRNVMIEKGDSVYLAMIYSGWPPKAVFETLTMLLRDVEERYRGRLERWNGTKKVLKGVDEMLQTFMVRDYVPGAWQPEGGIDEQEWVDILSKEN